eukprot:6691208-Ditylum_brightwellii.AAC.1
MKKIGITLEILENDLKTPGEWSKVTGHIILDVKMDFTRKSRWVLDGHKTPDLVGSTYVGAVSRESVRIAFIYTTLNNLDVRDTDIQNAYLQVPSSQKYYIVCGARFSLENIGKQALNRRALYGGKSAGKDFQNHIRDCMIHLGFTSCPADPDVWMRPAIHSDGEHPEKLLFQGITKYFQLKEKSVGPPKIYLGGSICK